MEIGKEKQIKNIMILGTCRTGKTTLSKRIMEEIGNYQLLEIDTILTAINKVIPNENIGFIHDNIKHNKLSKFTSILLKDNMLKAKNQYGFIINSDSLMPSDVFRDFELDNTIIVYLLDLKLTPKDKLKRVRKYDDKNEWTTRRTDEELLKHFEFDKQLEDKIMKGCREYSNKMFYIDTSENRDIEFDNVIEFIKKEK